MDTTSHRTGAALLRKEACRKSFENQWTVTEPLGNRTGFTQFALTTSIIVTA
jgi:hypothetical protein